MTAHAPDTLPGSDPSARAAAAAAWREAGAGARHLQCTLDGQPFLERVACDAVPGEQVARGDRNQPIEVRPRLSLDGDLELVTDHSRTRRFATHEDVVFSDAATAQFKELARTRLRGLATSGTRGMPLPTGDGSVGRDAEVAGRLVKKFGTEDTKRLRTVVALCPEATRTVSRLAAADDLVDLFLGSELVAMTRDFERVEHRRPYFRELFPMRNLGAPGAVAYESQVFDRKGRAEHTSDFRGRAPTVTISRQPQLRPLVWMRAGMIYSWLELQRWQHARSNGAPLPDFVREQLEAAREALLELENIALVFGNTQLSLVGVLTPNNGIPTPDAVANYAGVDPEVAVQMLLAGAVAITETEASDATDLVIALGTRDYVYVTTTPYDSTNSTNESIANAALRRGRDLGVRAIVRMPELAPSDAVKAYLEGLGYKEPLSTLYSGGMADGNTQKAVQLTFSRNPRRLRGVIGQDLMQLPPDRTSSETAIQVIMSTGGVEILQPKLAHRQRINDPA